MTHFEVSTPQGPWNYIPGYPPEEPSLIIIIVTNVHSFSGILNSDWGNCLGLELIKDYLAVIFFLFFLLIIFYLLQICWLQVFNTYIKRYLLVDDHCFHQLLPLEELTIRGVTLKARMTEQWNGRMMENTPKDLKDWIMEPQNGRKSLEILRLL